MKESNFAPVIIPTLNRYEHFKRCTESLSKNEYAHFTDLYIALDYPLNEYHFIGYNKIIEYIPQINGFKSVNTIKREKNFGAYENSNLLIKEVLKKYDSFFFTEDDNEFSQNTLEYINLGLDKFENDDSIFAICTSHHQIEIPNSAMGSYFILDSYSPMGFASWGKKYLKYFEFDKKQYIKNFLKDYSNYKYFKYERLYLISSMLESISKNYILDDGILTTYLIKNHMNCVFPSIHKVRNHGHDGSGVNCVNIIGTSPYANRIIDKNKNFEYIDESKEIIIKEIRNNIIKNFREPIFKRIFVKVRYYFYFLFGIILPSKIFKKIYKIFTR